MMMVQECTWAYFKVIKEVILTVYTDSTDHSLDSVYTSTTPTWGRGRIVVV